jgi:hypothetical protein
MGLDMETSTFVIALAQRIWPISKPLGLKFLRRLMRRLGSLLTSTFVIASAQRIWPISKPVRLKFLRRLMRGLGSLQLSESGRFSKPPPSCLMLQFCPQAGVAANGQSAHARHGVGIRISR